jgi:hypothetical protein
LRFVAGELERLNADRGPFTGKLDTSKIAIAGHFMSGLLLEASEIAASRLALSSMCMTERCPRLS